MTKSADVVVVGSGLAGCAAALAAADHGLRTILLEKGAVLGGKTAWSNGGLWIPGNDFARAAGIDDSLEDARLLALSRRRISTSKSTSTPTSTVPTPRCGTSAGWACSSSRRNKVSDIYYGIAAGTRPEGRMVEIALFSARELGPWREKVRPAQYQQRRSTFDEAVRWGGRGSFGAWDPAVQAEREAADARGLGAGLIAAFVKALLDRNVEIVLECAAQRLVVSDGRVIGIDVREGDGRDETIAVRDGVVLAAGGYENNAALMQNYEDLPMRGQFPGGLDGDALGDGRRRSVRRSGRCRASSRSSWATTFRRAMGSRQRFAPRERTSCRSRTRWS